jgi:hypothetical protein
MNKPMATPLRVDFVGILPTLFATCEHCMEVMHDTGMEPYAEQLEEYPADVKKMYFELSEMAQKLRAEFGDSVYVNPVDAASPQGIWMSIRYRIFKTPCVIIGGKKVFNELPSYDMLRQKVLESVALIRTSA